ncbi:hypothetical protein AB0J90_18550 [Micromonospora sp. NPDC049523]|uniref:hypothetical protein n=1 Tax=Micromonospora sp. NPDC049523 TaxID=3155921 RepID=UPI0034159286
MAAQLVPPIGEQVVPLLVDWVNSAVAPEYGHPRALIATPRATPERKLPGWDQGQFQYTEAVLNSSPAVSGVGSTHGPARRSMLYSCLWDGDGCRRDSPCCC